MPFDIPSREELEAAAGRTVPDVIGPKLRVLFCGINPSLLTAVVGHHFAHPSNRFWRALHESGFTDRLLDPSEQLELLRQGYGITNVVARATKGAADLERAEFVEGGRRLEEKVERYRPDWLAVLGLGAYRKAFDRPGAGTGPQDERVGPTPVWVLPNPSGLNAHYPPDKLADEFRKLREAVEAASEG